MNTLSDNTPNTNIPPSAAPVYQVPQPPLKKEEAPLIRRLRENYPFFGGLSLIYGVIFAFCLYRNLQGITFPICVIATLIFSVVLLKGIDRKLKTGSIPYMAGMVLLGISNCMTTSFFLHFFNIVGILILFFVFMLHQFYNDKDWNFPGYFKRLLMLLGTTIESIPRPYSHGIDHLKGKDTKTNRTILSVLIGCVIAMLILSIVLPLLLKSDAMFSKLFGEFLKYINFWTLLGVTFTFIIGFTACYAFFSALCKYNLPTNVPRKMKYYSPIIAITFTSIISVIYFVYCIIQILYPFMRVGNGLPDGMTYASYARGGFWELLFVSVINFLMVLICMYVFRENVVLKAILTLISGCTFIMIFSAGYRMILYIGVYHLTLLRVLVLWFLAVLTLTMFCVIATIYKKNFPLFRSILLIVSVFYIALSLWRPDAFICNYNIAHWDNISYDDLSYVMYSLSNDAAPYIAQIDPDKIKVEYDYQDYEYQDYVDTINHEMYNYFSSICDNMDNIYIRKMNYSRIRAEKAAQSYVKNHPNDKPDW